tara:strand:+ start:3923 stop:5200 length:1278 start_codon:yes stop_codon:yes gene_type:complete
MKKKFNAKALFDSHRVFVRLPSGISMLNDYPDSDLFIQKLSALVPNIEDDFVQAQQFLKSYSRKNESTYRVYRNEIERLLLWSWTFAGKSVVTLTRSDIELFFDFLNRPPSDWVATAVHDRFQLVSGFKCQNPLWRPFVVKISKQDRLIALENGNNPVPNRKAHKLSNQAMKISFSAIACFFDYLTEENYAFGNPIPAIRKQSPYLVKGATQKNIKRLSQTQWKYVLDAALRTADQDSRNERTLFIVAMLKSLYLRVSELSERPHWTPIWNHFWSDHDGNNWFKVFGKGNKMRDVSVPNALLPYIERYKNYRQETDPSFNSNSALVTKIRGVGGMSSRQIRRIVQANFNAAYLHMRIQGFREDAEALRSASTHWLRHTGASQDIAIRPLKHMADDLGHASMGTTDQVYIHSDMKERASSGKKRGV